MLPKYLMFMERKLLANRLKRLAICSVEECRLAFPRGNLREVFKRERSNIMNRATLLTILAMTGSMVCMEDAQARCCRSRCRVRTSCCAAPIATSFAAPCSTCQSAFGTAVQPMIAQPMPGTPVAVAGTSSTGTGSDSTYQSFSYEPGTQPVATSTAPIPAYQAPVPFARQSYNSIYDSVLRGNRKVTGQY